MPATQAPALIRIEAASAVAWFILGCALTPTCTWASDATSATRYDVIIETGMPHLEENLRYATRRERRCLTRADMIAMFPALNDSSLRGCTLGDERRQPGASVWTLMCPDRSATTGRATWRFDGPQIAGTLHLKLGGKNMTYWQRVTLQPLGACETGQER